jgi:hypothetical protein
MYMSREYGCGHRRGHGNEHGMDMDMDIDKAKEMGIDKDTAWALQ